MSIVSGRYVTAFALIAGCLIAAGAAQTVNVRYSLADALAGGDGTFPGTGAPGSTVIHLDAHAFTAGKGVVDGAFVPDSDKPVKIAGTGLTFDFSSRIGITANASAASKGAFEYGGASLITTSIDRNPDYAGDPAHHAYIHIEACQGITFDLNKIRASLGGAVAFTRFTARAGTATGAKINYWVIVDGAEKKYGTFEAGAVTAADLDLPIADGDHFLTLAVGEANVGGLNNTHGYFGDPVLVGTGAMATQIAAPAPADNSAAMLPWMPLRWGFGLGVSKYDVFLWKEGQTAPAVSTGTVATTSFFPTAYLDAGAKYHWKLVGTTSDGKTLAGPSWTFSTRPAGAVPAPAYDISPGAQAIRTAGYTVNGLKRIAAAGTPVKSGMIIAYYGDSNTDVIQWQVELVDSLKRVGAVSLNRGINGADAYGLRYGIRKYNAGGGLPTPKPFPDQIADDKADIAVIYIGINDAYQHPTAADPPTAKDVYKGHIQAMVDSALARKAKVVLVTPAAEQEKPDGSNIHDKELDGYMQACQEVAQGRSGVALVNARKAFIDYLKNNNFQVDDSGAVTFPRTTGVLNQDVVHHNPTGRHFMSDLVADGILRVLGTTVAIAPRHTAVPGAQAAAARRAYDASGRLLRAAGAPPPAPGRFPGAGYRR
jgi:lysophospholipase L1-like esterase